MTGGIFESAFNTFPNPNPNPNPKLDPKLNPNPKLNLDSYLDPESYPKNSVLFVDHFILAELLPRITI